VLSLYDPDRSKAPYADGRVQSWSVFEAALQARLERARSRHGAGIALLTGRVTSPTLLAQIGLLNKSLPEAKWYRYEPIEDDANRDGAIQAFGRALTAMPRFPVDLDRAAFHRGDDNAAPVSIERQSAGEARWYSGYFPFRHFHVGNDLLIWPPA
jgi:hypothetical protein